jgi:AmmeMemoRadiSam system protein B
MDGGFRMNERSDLRPSAIAGQWYPGNPQKLAASVDQYITAAVLPEIQGEIIALVVPHAGHVYSGPVAGYAFAAIQGMQPELVTIVSPMHQPYVDPLITSGHASYHTPLGPVPIDRKAVQDLNTLLTGDLGFGMVAVRNDREHSLEIELPFLQRVLGADFNLLPVMVRDQSFQVTQSLGLALASVLANRRALLVASTDLSHFYPQDSAKKLDNEMLRRIESFDPIAVLKAEEDGVGFACGRGAVAAVLWAAIALGGSRVQILNYATSGDISGDTHQVVGYGAAVITKTKESAS